MSMTAECKHILDDKNYTKSLQGRKIYKDQCVLCFHQPHKPQGLYVCMKCFNGFCPGHMEQHLHDHSHVLYVHELLTLKQVEEKYQINKIAIGVEGGALGGEEYITSYRIYCGECKSHDLSNSQILAGQIQSLSQADSPFKKQSLVSWQLQINPCEHTLTLEQDLVNKNLSCCSNCDLSTNLWLCLTCGNTGCGRKNWDGTGGNGHGIEHYNKSLHPVVVKLGTITAEGEASVYCYVCNNDVKDQFLQKHLAYLGIPIGQQKKTEKTIAQISLDLNLNFSLNKLLSGKEKAVKVLYGPDYTGMNNIGNTCYLNSVVQFLNSLHEFRQVYFKKGIEHTAQCKRIPAQCFYCQVTKVFWGLNSGKYSQKLTKKKIINEEEVTEEYQEGIKPFDFKLLIAKDNAEFSSNRQQDALEYLQLVFDKLQKQQKFIGANTTQNFDFTSVNRLVCNTCHGYKLIDAKTNEWKFPIPHPTKEDIDLFYKKLDLQTDDQVKKSKLFEDPEYDVKFQSCLSQLKQGDSVIVNCPQCKSNQVFSSHHYFKTTPKYLIAVPNRFVVENWVPKKLNALIKVDQQLELSPFFLENAPEKGKLLKEEQKKEYSEQNLVMLTSMGYSQNASKRALIATKDNLEAAGNWILQNFDNNIDAPLEEEGPQEIGFDAASIAAIKDLGFDQSQAKIALLKNKSDPQASIEWLFNVDGDVTEFLHLLNPAQGKEQSKPKSQKPAHSHYSLKAVIVHLGKSVHHGHYVVYLKKEGEWVLFNDEKVTVPKEAVLGKGYIYIYEGK